MNPRFEDVKYHICSPYLIPILIGFVDLHMAKSLEVYISCVHDKYGVLPELDITILLEPLTCEKYWNLYILGDHSFVHFDYMIIVGLHCDSTIFIC